MIVIIAAGGSHDSEREGPRPRRNHERPHRAAARPQNT
jgi:hypothetical protein